MKRIFFILASLLFISCKKEKTVTPIQRHELAIQRTLDRLAETFDKSGDGSVKFENGNLVISIGKEQLLQVRNHPLALAMNEEYTYQSVEGEQVKLKVLNDRQVEVTVPIHSNQMKSVTTTALLDTFSLFGDDYFPYCDTTRMYCVKYLIDDENLEGFVAIPQKSQPDHIDSSLTNQLVYFQCRGRKEKVPQVLRNQWILRRVEAN